MEREVNEMERRDLLKAFGEFVGQLFQAVMVNHEIRHLKKSFLATYRYVGIEVAFGYHLRELIRVPLEQCFPGSV